MPTLDTIRNRVRSRLEELTPALWDDAALDEVIDETLAEYNALLPRESVAALAVNQGDREVALPAGVWAISRVVLPDGSVAPARGQPVGRTAGERQAWDHFAGSLRFTRPLPAGTLTVWHLSESVIEDVPARDAWLIVLGAVWRALERRGVQEWKRGLPDGVSQGLVTRRARDEYQSALRSRRRRARTVYLLPT